MKTSNLKHPQQFTGNSPHPGHTSGSKAGQWIALALCAAVLAASTVEQFIHSQPDYAGAFAPNWIPIAAAGFAAAGIIRMNGHSRWFRIQRVLLWSGILLMVWTASGLPFDLLRLTPLIPLEVDWPGLVTRSLALAAFVMLARNALAMPDTSVLTRAASWYGYAAFLLALPYPVLRLYWALGGTVGLMHPGAAGEGFAPLLIAIPWVLAAMLSLLLISKRHWKPRRLLLIAGWTATAIVAMIGPAALWSVITTLMKGGDQSSVGIALWVVCLFYGSWFLWAIAAGAATRSYQLRSARGIDGQCG